MAFSPKNQNDRKQYSTAVDNTPITRITSSCALESEVQENNQKIKFSGRLALKSAKLHQFTQSAASSVLRKSSGQNSRQTIE